METIQAVGGAPLTMPVALRPALAPFFSLLLLSGPPLARSLAQELGPGKIVVVNLSGRGDKDTDTVAKALEGRLP